MSEAGPPEPAQPPRVSVEELRVRLGRLLASFIELAVAMGLLFLLGKIIDGASIEVFGIEISGFEIVGVLRLAAVVYFGYSMLSELLWLLDISAKRLSRLLGLAEVRGVRRIGQDIIYLMGLALAWYAVSPLVSLIPPGAVRLLPSLGFLAIGVLLLYDLAKSIYRLFKEKFERLLDGLTEFLARGLLEQEEGSPELGPGGEGEPGARKRP